jgi:hypothetical protein
MTQTTKLSTWKIILGDEMMNNLTRGVAKTTMPSINKYFDGTKHKLPEF